MGGWMTRMAARGAAAREGGASTRQGAERAKRMLEQSNAKPLEMDPELLRIIEKVVAEKKEAVNPYPTDPEEFALRRKWYAKLHRERDDDSPPPGRLTQDQLLKALKWRADLKTPPITRLAERLHARGEGIASADEAKATAKSVLTLLGTPVVWTDSSNIRCGTWVDMTNLFGFETAVDAPPRANGPPPELPSSSSLPEESFAPGTPPSSSSSSSATAAAVSSAEEGPSDSPRSPPRGRGPSGDTSSSSSSSSS